MLVAVFGDAHAHAEALSAVVAAAAASGADQLWSLGDMVGRGPDPEHAVGLTRERCAVALIGNHDHGVTGAADLSRYGAPGSPRASARSNSRASGWRPTRWRGYGPASRRHAAARSGAGTAA